MPEIGSHAQNAYQGHRSEIIAEFFFSGLGTVIPVPRPADTGVDFYCTLTEPAGKKAFSTHTFTVQVKSNAKPITVESTRSIEWLLRHPLPIFLCVVDKKRQQIHVYHMLPRFYIWAHPPLPKMMTIVPEQGTEGTSVQWEPNNNFSVSAPIISLTFADIADKNTMKKLKEVLVFWIGFEEENLSRIRNHILQFRMPASYETNSTKVPASVTQWVNKAPVDDLQAATNHLGPNLAWLSAQQWENDPRGALLMLALHRHLCADSNDAYAVHHKLNAACAKEGYAYEMADKVLQTLSLFLGIPRKSLPVALDRVLGGIATKDID